MHQKAVVAALSLLVVCPVVLAQNTWVWSHRFELRADYRWSEEESHPIPGFPFPPDFIPPGQSRVLLQTPDPGHHVELNVAEATFDVAYGDWFLARAKVHAQARHRANPTTNDRQFDADELFIRFGRKPEMLERPDGTSFFVQAGKAPKMERQPTRLLESYGLAATAFNRFEDTQILVGGTVGRNVYWRAQASNGNPLFFRDANALAGDNGTPERVPPNPSVDIKSGFPIFYDAEVESLFFETGNVEVGGALGYRWQTEDQRAGFDLIAFAYRRDLAESADLYGTFYNGDLDLLDGAFGLGGFRLTSNEKEDYGARLYGEWGNLAGTLQYTTQDIGGLERYGWEAEVGYQFPLRLGWIESIQPAARFSRLENHYGNPGFPAPSVNWDWDKIDAGVRVGLRHGLDVTAEYTVHKIESRFPLGLREALVTLRWRV
jgi:hypothetical protein